MKNEIEENQRIQSLDPIEHLKLRPGMWIGGVVPSEHEVWVLDENDKIQNKKLTYTEGLLKVINEAIDNSFDEAVKTNCDKANKITIEMTKDTFSIEDNGRGIPVKKDANGDWQCVNAVCKLMTGSNFNDDKRETIGANGVGIKGLNAFSTYFECVTCDGTGKMKIVCKDNLTSEKHTELTPTNKTGTKIIAKPDFKRFNVKEFSDGLITIIKSRLKFLSWFYPKCSISFNGEKVNIKAKDLVKLFPTPSVSTNNDNVFICAYASEEPEVLTYVNGLYLSRGGTHIDYIMDKIVEVVRNKVGKKFKGIKPADIKNRLGLVVFFKGFPNCAYDSQTKEALKNLQSEISKFIDDNNVDIDGLLIKITKDKEILDNITGLFKLKEELAEKKALEKLGKTRKSFDSEKYFPPVGKTKNKYLMITEGFSAFGGISPILGRKGIGYYMLKGKPLNALDLKPSKLMENQEVRELVQLLGIDMSNPNTDMLFEKVVILSDADNDGTAIAGLVITLFSIIAPKMLKEGRICRMETPLLIGLKGNKVEEYYYTFPESSKMKKELNYKYLKGLGSWTKDRLDQVIAKEGGMDNLIKPYIFDKNTMSSIQNWFGKDTEPRKKALRRREFHIDNI